MDKVKEKPRGSSAVREKGADVVRRGLESGADRLRTQLRDAAQQGQRDEYGGDQMEDAAACAPGRPPLTEQAAFPLLLKGRTGRHSPPRPSLDVRRRATKGRFLPQARRAAQP